MKYNFYTGQKEIKNNLLIGFVYLVKNNIRNISNERMNKLEMQEMYLQGQINQLIIQINALQKNDDFKDAQKILSYLLSLENKN